MLICKKCKTKVDQQSKSILVCPGCDSLLDSTIDVLIVGKHYLATDRELKKESLWIEKRNKNTILKKQQHLRRQKGAKE